MSDVSDVSDMSATLDALDREREARQAAGPEFFFLTRPLDGWLHVAEVEYEAASRSPAWTPEAENPPVSARKALELADAYVTKEYGQRNDHGIPLRRELRGVTLMPFVADPADATDADPDAEAADVKPGPVDRWLWAVSYEWFPTKGGLSGEPRHVVVPVLMDGTVVPVVRDGEAAKQPVGTGLF